VKRFSEIIEEKYDKRYSGYICYFTNQMKEELYTKAFAEKILSHDSRNLIVEKFKQVEKADKIAQGPFVDMLSYLPEDLLVKVDIATMINSLESRSPFLDHKMVELAASIPSNLKLKGLNNKKYILKKAFEGTVPNEILYRPKKGFGVPIEKWFKNDLEKYTRETLLAEKTLKRNLFQKEFIQKLLHTHKNTRINHAPRIWALLTLELWFREYFD
jgi:asparagine synthase (glutamine-hydrolysing)